MAECVTVHPEFESELANLRRSAPREHIAILNAERKLQSLGPQLGFPHSSAVRSAGAPPLRELRPRRGRSPWRVLYATTPDIVLLALAPEARRDPRGFDAAVVRARGRYREILA